MARFLPATAERGAANTDEAINRRIQDEMERSVAYYAAHPERIGRRLDELGREWDIERLLEANASTLMLVGLGLGIAVDRRWLALPTVVAGFLLQHALQGWCPPLPVFRRLGVRTAEEIDRERTALRILRGDFRAGAEAGAAPPTGRGQAVTPAAVSAVVPPAERHPS